MMMFFFLMWMQLSPDSLFNSGAQYLQNKDAVSASRILSELDESGVENGPMLINLGIAYTQLDSLGLAKYYFTRAGRYDEVKTQSETGLTFVNQQLQRRASGLPVLALNRIQNRFIASFDAFWAILLPLLLLYVGAGVLIWHIYLAHRWKQHAATILLSLSLITLIGYAVVANYINRYELAVMIRQEALLREAPTEDSATLIPTFEGYDLRVDRKRSTDEWVFVVLINGSSGWLPASSVRTY